MLGRSASLIQRQPRPHAAWSRLVDVLKNEMSEEELLSLTLETVRSLATHAGLSSPLDVAHIELAWGERQPKDVESQRASGTALGQPPQTDVGRQEAEKPAAESKQPPSNGSAKGKTLQRPSSSNGLNSSLTRTGSGKYKGVQSKVAEQIRAPSPPRADSPTNRDSTGGDPNGKIVRKDVPSRVDSGKIRRSTSFDADGDVICVEDLKDVFTRYAAFANGSPKELDSSRFAKLVKECDLLDKLFTLREADVLFTKCKNSAADRRIPYHVFRMKLLPEMAAKKHCSIADIVKLCNHHGGPELRRRPESAERQEEVQPPPPPPAQPPAELEKKKSDLEKKGSTNKMVKVPSLRSAK